MKNMKKLTALGLAAVVTLTGCSMFQKGIDTEYLTLEKYKGVTVTMDDYIPTKTEMTSKIQGDLESKDLAAKKDITDEAAKEGDMANLDFAGTMDGKAVEAATSTGYDLELGSGDFVEGFEKNIIGMKVGEEKDFTVKFPEDYQAAEMAGKDVSFHVKVNKITRTEYPKMTDEIVKKIDKKYKTVEEYYKDTMESMTKEKKKLTVDLTKGKPWTKIIDSVTMKGYPQKEVDKKVKEAMKNYEDAYKQQGTTLDAALKESKTKKADFKMSLTKEVRNTVKEELVVKAIAEKEKITVSDKEYKKKAKQYAKESNFDSAKALEKQFGKKMITNVILTEKVQDFCYDNAEIKEHPNTTKAKKQLEKTFGISSDKESKSKDDSKESK